MMPQRNWFWTSKWRKWLPLASCIGALFILAACSTASPPAPTKNLSPLERRGQEVFEKKGCFQSCHGAGVLAASANRHTMPNRPGPVPPDLTKSPYRSDGWLMAYLMSPRSLLPYSPMSPYRDIPNADMKALMAYLRGINTNAVPDKVPLVDQQLIPQVLSDPGNYRAGRDAYRTYCQGCHGQWGNGKGPVGQLMLPEPRDFTDAAWLSKQTNVYLFSAVSYGKVRTAMPAFNDILTLEQRSQVLDYIGYFADPVLKQRMELPSAAKLDDN